MARMPTEREAEQEKIMKENDQRIRKILEDQFVERWKNASEEERARMLFRALYEKVDKDHSHPRGMF